MKNKKARLNNLPCFPQMNFRKRGWILILEATIAILIVSGALLVVYSQQADEVVSPEEYFESLQGQILADVSASSDLRLNVLNVEEENFGDANFNILNNFIGTKIPSGFGYSIRVCELNDTTDYCRMDTPTYIATVDKDIYTEEIIVASEIGDGTDAIYNPTKLKLFVWEGESFGTDCNNTCSPAGTVYNCSNDLSQVLKRTCGNFDEDYCLEWEGVAEVFETCEEGWECVEGLGICTEVSEFFNLTCEKTTVSETGCVHNFDDECDEWNGGGVETGGCGFLDSKDEYVCYNIETIETDCLEDPECPDGYTEVEKRGCSVFVEECEDDCSPAGPVYSCSGDDAKILIRTCGDFDDDDCLEWDGNFKVFKACGVKEQCEEGNSECVSTWAELSLDFSLQSIIDDDPYTRYIHTRTFEETNGVGVTLTEGQLCYQVEGSCNSASVNYRIEGDDELIRTNEWFNTLHDWEKFTLKYWGTDDNGNSVYVEQTVCVEKGTFLFDVDC